MVQMQFTNLILSVCAFLCPKFFYETSTDASLAPDTCKCLYLDYIAVHLGPKQVLHVCKKTFSNHFEA